VPHIDPATLHELSGFRTIVRGQPHTEAVRTHLGVDTRLIAEVLVRARHELRDPSRWTQLMAGLTSYGVEVREPSSLFMYPENQIVKLCSDGAIAWAAFWLVPVGSRPNLDDVIYAAEDAFQIAAGQDVAVFNDAVGRSHSEVISMFERAIAMMLGAWQR
jgi:hypothetical protein